MWERGRKKAPIMDREWEAECPSSSTSDPHSPTVVNVSHRSPTRVINSQQQHTLYHVHTLALIQYIPYVIFYKDMWSLLLPYSKKGIGSIHSGTVADGWCMVCVFLTCTLRFDRFFVSTCGPVIGWSRVCPALACWLLLLMNLMNTEENEQQSLRLMSVFLDSV